MKVCRAFSLRTWQAYSIDNCLSGICTVHSGSGHISIYVIFHFPTSSGPNDWASERSGASQHSGARECSGIFGASEWLSRAREWVSEQTSEQTSDWPITNGLISKSSDSLCGYSVMRVSSCLFELSVGFTRRNGGPLLPVTLEENQSSKG